MLLTQRGLPEDEEESDGEENDGEHDDDDADDVALLQAQAQFYAEEERNQSGFQANR